MSILKFDNVSKIFYTKTQQTVAISDLSFEINEGEFVALIGPSGCGKTTILSLVCGLIEPTSGRVIRSKGTVNNDKIIKTMSPNFDGSERVRLRPFGSLSATFERSDSGGNREQNGHANVGYMLQRDQLFEWRTIERNVTLGLEIQRKHTPENVEKARNLLKKYGLWEFRKHYPQQLSGGMRQRAALIRTLATNPDLLLLDEPFSALDFQTRLEVCDDVYSIIKNENKTALLVTHDISEAIALADKVIVLTARPATLKAVHYTYMNDIDTPLHRRQSPNFAPQFELLHNLLHGVEGE